MRQPGRDALEQLLLPKQSKSLLMFETDVTLGKEQSTHRFLIIEKFPGQLLHEETLALTIIIPFWHSNRHEY